MEAPAEAQERTALSLQGGINRIYDNGYVIPVGQIEGNSRLLVFTVGLVCMQLTVMRRRWLWKKVKTTL